MRPARLLFPIAAAAILASCSTMSSARIADLSIRQGAEPLQLKPAYEVSFAREDLVRATHTVTSTSYVNGVMSTSSREVPNDYSELAIDFGNGIIMDYDNNLCIDLLRFYGLDRLSNYHIVKTPKGFSLEGTTTFDLKDAVFTSTAGMYRKVVQNDNSVQVESGLLHSKRTINVGQQSIELIENILGVDVKKSAALIDDRTLQVKGFWKNSTFKKEASDRIAMEGYFQMIHDNDHITIIYTGIFGITTKRTFFRTEKGLMFFDDQNRGVEIIKEGDFIRIERDGQPAAEYKITTS